MRAAGSPDPLLDSVLDLMREGVLVLDAADRLVRMNAHAEHLLGWRLPPSAPEGARGLHFRDLEGPRLRTRLSLPQRVRRRGGPVRVEHDVLMRRDGSPLAVSCTAAPLRLGSQAPGCVVVFADDAALREHRAARVAELEDLMWLGRIDTALEHDRFELHAQPVVDLATGRVMHRELLLRLRDVDGNLLLPGVFLPAAERHGMLPALDRWVIRRGIEIAADEGSPVTVNISSTSLTDPGLSEWVQQELADGAAATGRVGFELTETAIIEDEQQAVRFIDCMRHLGASVALDDFGAGYAGLGYIKRLPVDTVKIDIDYVRDITTDTASQHVVMAVVALAKGMGLRTIAEGVEDVPTVTALRAAGVDMGQGWHFGRPAPIAG